MNDPTTIRMLRYLEGKASAGEVAALNDLLLADAEARGQFLQLSAQAQALHELTASEEKRVERARRMVFLSGLAALLMLGAFCGGFRGENGQRTTGIQVAEEPGPSVHDAERWRYPVFIGATWGGETESGCEPLPLRLIEAAGDAASGYRNSAHDDRQIAHWFSREPTWDDLFDSPLNYPAFVWATEFAQGESGWSCSSVFPMDSPTVIASEGSLPPLAIDAVGLLQGPPTAHSRDATLLFAL